MTVWFLFFLLWSNNVVLFLKQVICMFLYVEFLLTYKTIWDGSFWECSQIIPLGFSLLELVLATELLWGQGNSHCTGLPSSEHVTDARSHRTVPLVLQSVISRSLVSVTNGGFAVTQSTVLSWLSVVPLRQLSRILFHIVQFQHDTSDVQIHQVQDSPGLYRNTKKYRQQYNKYPQTIT